MAYEDYFKDDPMPNFTDDVSYYDEELGFYDDFGEKIADPADTEDNMDDETTAEEPMVGSAPASPAASTSIDRDFRESLNDPATADQLEDPDLHDEAKEDYADTQ